MKKLIEFKEQADRRDILRALLDNRTLKTSQGYSVFYDCLEDEPFRINKGDADEVYIYHDHSITHEEIEVEWYENIPDCGTLCWVWDHPEDFKILALIFQYNSDAKIFKVRNKVRNKADSYTYFPHASPATLSEIDKFLIAEQ